MDILSKPNSGNLILGIAQSYGPMSFWVENLLPLAQPDNIWRALLVCGCQKLSQFSQQYRFLLDHPDSRVRAWACFALGCIKDRQAAGKISSLTSDPSNRVRTHARQAIRKIGLQLPLYHPNYQKPPKEILVLISDDSAEMRNTLSEWFIRFGYRVISARSDKETIDLAQQYKPQVLISDNQKGFDNLNGLNMIFDLSRMAELREMIIFMVSADFVEPPFLWNGGDYYFTKPRGALPGLAMDINDCIQDY